MKQTNIYVLTEKGKILAKLLRFGFPFIVACVISKIFTYIKKQYNERHFSRFTDKTWVRF